MFSPWRTPRGTSGPRSPPGGLPRALCGGRARTRRTGREVERAGARRSKPCPIRRAGRRMQRGGRRRCSREGSGQLSLGGPRAGLGECQDAHRVRYGAVLGRRESANEAVFFLESELGGDRLPEGRPKIPVFLHGEGKIGRKRKDCKGNLLVSNNFMADNEKDDHRGRRLQRRLQ